MRAERISWKLLLLMCALAPLAAHADVVNKDNTIVQGDACIGFDCVNDEVFENRGIKLRENNTRVRLYDSSATTRTVTEILENGYITGELGNKWGLDANESANEGANDFLIREVSLQDYTILSDGTAIDYDCSTFPVTESGTIPEGEPIENSSNCQPVTRTLRRNGLVLGATANGGVGLGHASATAATVALGRADLQRRLAHVADALGETDVLIKRGLKTGALDEQQARADKATAALDKLAKQIRELEYRTGLKDRPGTGGSWGLSLLLLSILLLARRDTTRRV